MSTGDRPHQFPGMETDVSGIPGIEPSTEISSREPLTQTLSMSQTSTAASGQIQPPPTTPSWGSHPPAGIQIPMDMKDWLSHMCREMVSELKGTEKYPQKKPQDRETQIGNKSPRPSKAPSPVQTAETIYESPDEGDTDTSDANTADEEESLEDEDSQNLSEEEDPEGIVCDG